MNGWTDQLNVGQHAGCGIGLASVAPSAGGFEKICVAFFDMERRRGGPLGDTRVLSLSSMGIGYGSS